MAARTLVPIVHQATWQSRASKFLRRYVSLPILAAVSAALAMSPFMLLFGPRWWQLSVIVIAFLTGAVTKGGDDREH